jgi:hypothetical protein
MIENDKQYRVSQKQVRLLNEALESRISNPPEEVHPLLRQAELHAMKAQIGDIESELRDYEERGGDDA